MSFKYARLSCGCYLLCKLNNQKVVHIPEQSSQTKHICYTVEEYNTALNNKENWTPLNQHEVYVSDNKLYIKTLNIEKIIEISHFIGVFRVNNNLKITLSKYAHLLGKSLAPESNPFNTNLQYYINIDLPSSLESRILYYKVLLGINADTYNLPQWSSFVT